MPHFKFLQGDEESYRGYLQASWRTNRGIEEKCDTYRALKESVTTKGIENPIITVLAPDGRKLIVEGNHRAAIATYFDIICPEQCITGQEFLERVVVETNSEFYGTGHRGMPYHSIFFKGAEVLAGRRHDLAERAAKIGTLEGKSIVDFGSNFGGASFLAIESGAASVVGIEFSEKIAIAACRLANYFGYSPDFRIGDLAKPMDIPSADVGFIFSVDKHVANVAEMAKTVAKSVNETVYFEAHEKAQIPCAFLNLFTHIEFLGMNFGDRQFFRCHMKGFNDRLVA